MIAVLALLSAVAASGQASGVVTITPWNNVAYGDRLRLDATISGWSQPYTVQWDKNGVPVPTLSWAGGDYFEIGYARPADAGVYTVTYTKPDGTIVTASRTVTVTGSPVPPRIQTQPLSATLVAGTTAQFVVRATYPDGDTYQWLHDDQPVVGANGPVLTIANAQAADAGGYSVTVTNDGGSVVSGVAVLSVVLPVGVVSVRADTPYSTEFVKADGTLWSVGTLYSLAASFTDGVPRDFQLTPRLLPTAAGVVDSLSGWGLSVLNADGTLWYTGPVAKPYDPQRSLTANPNFFTPQPVPLATDAVSVWNIRSDGTLWTVDAELKNPTSIAAGLGSGTAGMFIKSDGTLWGQGNNDEGQLGDGTTTFRDRPVQVATRVVSFSNGSYHTLFIKSDGSLWGVGRNLNGELGDGAVVNRLRPVLIATGVVAAKALPFYSLFIKTDGTLWGMGANGYGQLGDGTTSNRFSPVLLAAGVRAIAAGTPYHSLILKTDGSLWATGQNSRGQLGDGTTVNRSTPVAVATGVVAAAASDYGFNSFFLKADGSLWAMGYNGQGQLGDGSMIDRATPVQIAGGPLALPPAPTGLVATDGTLGGVARISWRPAVNTTSYEVWRSRTNDPATAVRLVRGLSTPLHYDVTAVQGISYFYWVKALNGIGTSEFSAAALGSAGIAPFPPVPFADFNGDGRADLLWSNSITGERTVSLMDGTTQLGTSTMGDFLLEWTIAATGDFNGDNKPDIVWSSNLTGERALWLMNGTNLLGISTLGIFPLEWTVAATGDFNGDNKPDIVWSNSITGERALWLMNGTNLLGISTLGFFPLEWTVAATGDFNFDGKPDIVWSNSLTGERALWLMDGTQFLGVSTLGIFPLEWTVSGVGDYNGDGNPDIIWSNSITGEHAIWFMNGTQFLYSASLGVYPLEWSVRN